MAQSQHLEHRQQVRRQQVRGLLLLALVALLFAVLRVGVSNVFSPDWWRAW